MDIIFKFQFTLILTQASPKRGDTLLLIFHLVQKTVLKPLLIILIVYNLYILIVMDLNDHRWKEMIEALIDELVDPQFELIIDTLIAQFAATP